MGCNSSKDAHGANIKKPTPEEGFTHCGPWLKTADDLVDFPKFPAEHQQSSVARFLSKEIWDEYKDQKDEYGVSFKLNIFSGCQNVDSGIGAYAGSAEAYTKFNKFFDQVIQDYHGHGPSDMHKSDMSAEGLNIPDLTDDEKAMIVSTRIRVGRNVAGLPLGPGITKEQRNQVMNTVVEACNTFEGELQGKFYPLATMSEEDRKSLVENHFLFK